MVDIHDIVGRLREQLQQVNILGVLQLMIPPAILIAISGFMLSYKPYSSTHMRPIGTFADRTTLGNEYDADPRS